MFSLYHFQRGLQTRCYDLQKVNEVKSCLVQLITILIVIKQFQNALVLYLTKLIISMRERQSEPFFCTSCVTSISIQYLYYSTRWCTLKCQFGNKKLVYILYLLTRINNKRMSAHQSQRKGIIFQVLDFTRATTPHS